ncbi:MAG TPA: hypothetical protein VGK30_07260 [Candidatus Binatia bacterium]|jgi:REP element-mobilizing transposase RayT
MGKNRLIKMPHRSRQLALTLTTPCGWGGRRPGAGRKRQPGAPITLPHVSRAGFKRLPAHVTLRLRSDAPSLRTIRIVRAIERSFAAGCTRPGFRLVHYSLQGSHAHLIVEAQDRAALGRGMKAIGSRIARAVNRIARRTGPVLADRYHVRMLPTPKEVRVALRYVLLNARHHTGRIRAKLAGVRLDPASSARWFDGWKRGSTAVIEGNAGGAPGGPPVARARTWLLTVGWRRHGLIDPADVPG